MSIVRVLLPSAAVVRQYGGDALQLLLRRGDALQPAAPGRAAAIERCFEPVPRKPFASAAVRRQGERGDAGSALWVAADPVHVQADMTSLRLMGVGGLELAPDEIEALLRALRPVCGDLGFELSAIGSDHWYLRALTSNDIPLGGDPQDLLGADLEAHLPASPKWRRLLNETQIVLHQHAVNQRRVAQGRTPVNSLWFWGGGVLPHGINSTFSQVSTDDDLLRAWATRKGAAIAAADADASASGDRLLECWSPQGLQSLQSRALPVLLRELRRGRFEAIEFECVSGERHRCKSWHRWRFWRANPTRIPA